MDSILDFWHQMTANPLLFIAVTMTLGVILVNGWTDAPNAIATCVVTRCMPPRAAILMAAVFNFLGVFVMTLVNAAVAETITKMVDFGEDPDQAIIALMAASGMRASEIGWLNVGAIRRRTNGYIYALRKGQNIRKVFVAEFAIPYIEVYLSTRGAVSDDDPLFVTMSGRRINRDHVDDILRTRQEKLGLRTGTHNIRYTVLNSVERFADPAVARDIAGHKSMNVTNRYMVTSAEERSRAVENLPWAEKMGVHEK